MIDAEPVMKQQLIKLLRKKLRNNGVAHSHVGLPRDIDFSSRNGILRTHVSNPVLNMQTNSSAFEAWIMVLKAWLPHLAEKVELSCSLPPNYSVGSLGEPEACHVNRFLYRAGNFLRLYPEWFSFDESLQRKVEEFMHWLKNGRCYLNHPLRPRRPVSTTQSMERTIESWLTFKEGRERLSDLWGLDPKKIFNQLPVGVFLEPIQRGTAVFTRGAAAIDLWGVSSDGKTLHIIELKSGRNANIGVISEILFYTFVICDTCVAKDRLFQFGRYRKSPVTNGMTVIQNRGLEFQRLHSHVLAESFHPLLSDKMVALLNEGLSVLGIKFDTARYDYDSRSLPA